MCGPGQRIELPSERKRRSLVVGRDRFGERSLRGIHCTQPRRFTMPTLLVEEVQSDAQRRRRYARDAEGDDRSVARLFRCAQAGDDAARSALIERFLPLSRSLARRYRRSSESADDLMQVASLALVKAVDRFDADRDLAFSTFAVPTILGELKRHFRDTAWAVHMPRSLSEGALRVEKTERELANETGRRPSAAEIAEAMGEDLEWVMNVLDASRAHDALSLDAKVDTPEGDGETLAGTLGGEDERFDYVEERDAVAGCIGDLSERERA